MHAASLLLLSWRPTLSVARHMLRLLAPHAFGQVCRAPGSTCFVTSSRHGARRRSVGRALLSASSATPFCGCVTSSRSLLRARALRRGFAAVSHACLAASAIVALAPSGARSVLRPYAPLACGQSSRAVEVDMPRRCLCVGTWRHAGLSPLLRCTDASVLPVPLRMALWLGCSHRVAGSGTSSHSPHLRLVQRSLRCGPRRLAHVAPFLGLVSLGCPADSFSPYA